MQHNRFVTHAVLADRGNQIVAMLFHIAIVHHAGLCNGGFNVAVAVGAVLLDAGLVLIATLIDGAINVLPGLCYPCHIAPTSGLVDRSRLVLTVVPPEWSMAATALGNGGATAAGGLVNRGRRVFYVVLGNNRVVEAAIGGNGSRGVIVEVLNDGAIVEAAKLGSAQPLPGPGRKQHPCPVELHASHCSLP